MKMKISTLFLKFKLLFIWNKEARKNIKQKIYDIEHPCQYFAGHTGYFAMSGIINTADIAKYDKRYPYTYCITPSERLFLEIIDTEFQIIDSSDNDSYSNNDSHSSNDDYSSSDGYY